MISIAALALRVVYMKERCNSERTVRRRFRIRGRRRQYTAFDLTGHVSPHKYDKRRQQFQTEMSFRRSQCNKIYIMLLYSGCRFYFFREGGGCSFYCLLHWFRCVCTLYQTCSELSQHFTETWLLNHNYLIGIHSQPIKIGPLMLSPCAVCLPLPVLWRTLIQSGFQFASSQKKKMQLQFLEE